MQAHIQGKLLSVHPYSCCTVNFFIFSVVGTYWEHNMPTYSVPCTTYKNTRINNEIKKSSVWRVKRHTNNRWHDTQKQKKKGHQLADWILKEFSKFINHLKEVTSLVFYVSMCNTLRGEWHYCEGILCSSTQTNRLQIQSKSMNDIQSKKEQQQHFLYLSRLRTLLYTFILLYLFL